MSAFIDAQCRKCKRKIGWCGTMATMPMCKCGFRPPQEELDQADAQMEEMERLILQSPHRSSGEELRKQRRLAGLTLGQAAERLNLLPLELSRFEQGVRKPDEELAARMGSLYGVGPEGSDARA